MRKIVTVMNQSSNMGDQMVMGEIISFPWVRYEAKLFVEGSMEFMKLSECEELKEGGELEACGRVS